MVPIYIFFITVIPGIIYTDGGGGGVYPIGDMYSISCMVGAYENRPSHPFNAGTEHVGFGGAFDSRIKTHPLLELDSLRFCLPHIYTDCIPGRKSYKTRSTRDRSTTHNLKLCVSTKSSISLLFLFHLYKDIIYRQPNDWNNTKREVEIGAQ